MSGGKAAAMSTALAWLRAATRRFWANIGPGAAERVAWALTVLTVGAGLWLRARGYLWAQTALWLDEASWAMRIFERPLVQSLIRPIGFLAVSKFLASTFSNTETVLRALPWTAGIAATLSAPFLARRLYRSLGARLLFVAVIAFSPIAIDFSKEFKPYSLSLALHLGIVLLTLRYSTSGRGSDLARALAFAGVGSFFAQDLVLAFPGAFLVMGLTALKKQRAHLVAVAAVAAVIILGLALQYFLMWRYLPPDHTEFWGSKYNVFHTPREPRGYLLWSLDRYGDVVAMPGLRRTTWAADWLSPLSRQRLRHADQVLWMIVHAAGLFTLAWQRRWRDALLVVMPLVVLWGFNRAGFWPIGAFRTNVFTVVYSGAIAAMAVDGRAGQHSVWRVLCPALLLVYVPLALFEQRWHAHKQTFTYDSTFPRVIDWLVAAKSLSPGGPPEIVILDRRSCDPWRYYTTYHPRVSRRVAGDLKRKYLVKCSTDDANLPQDLLAGAVVGRRSWAVLHVMRPFDTMMKRGKFGSLRVIARHDAGSHTVVAVTPVPVGKRALVQEAPAEQSETLDDE